MSPQQAYVPVQLGPMRTKVATWSRESGDELFLFVHGLGCSKKSWRDAWSRPELREKSLLAVDLPGFGHSPLPDNFGCELEDHAGILAALVDAHASRKIHLVAHSMGGSVAVLLPERMLARLKRLTLIEARLVNSSCGLASGSASVNFEKFKNETFPQFRKIARRDQRSAYDLDRVELEAFYRSARSLTRWANSKELLHRFLRCPCPTSFVYGGVNTHLGELTHIDAARKVSIADAGHFVMQDQPQALYHHLAS